MNVKLDKNIILNVFKKLKKLKLNKMPAVPKDMRVGKEDSDGWSEYKLIKQDQKNVKHSKPVSSDYLTFISDKKFFDLEFKNGIRIYGINDKDTLNKLIANTPQKISSLGFISIGNINDSDYICVDSNNNVKIFDFSTYKEKKSLKSFNEFINKLVNISVEIAT